MVEKCQEFFKLAKTITEEQYKDFVTTFFQNCRSKAWLETVRAQIRNPLSPLDYATYHHYPSSIPFHLIKRFTLMMTNWIDYCASLCDNWDSIIAQTYHEKRVDSHQHIDVGLYLSALYERNCLLQCNPQISFDFRKPLSILDIGCGSGYYAPLLIKDLTIASYFGMDIIAQALLNNFEHLYDNPRIKLFSHPFLEVHQMIDVLREREIYEKIGAIFVSDFLHGRWNMRLVFSDLFALALRCPSCKYLIIQDSMTEQKQKHPAIYDLDLHLRLLSGGSFFSLDSLNLWIDMENTRKVRREFSGQHIFSEHFQTSPIHDLVVITFDRGKNAN